MKAISLWQPWASLWLSPRKIHETRHWQTRYRGWLLVHAAKRIVTDFGHTELERILRDEFGPNWAKELPRGAILGKVRLIDCKRTDHLSHFIGDDWYSGDFSPGRYAWARAEYEVFEQPIPYRGAQGFFEVPDHILRGAV